MGVLLQVAAVIYLIAVWGITALVIGIGGNTFPPLPGNYSSPSQQVAVLVIGAAVVSIPAVALFAFGQLVNDTRAMRNYLAEMSNQPARRDRTY